MYVVILVKICAYSLDMLSLQASGILGDKALDDKFIYISNDDKQNIKKWKVLTLFVWNKPINWNESTQSLRANQ